MLRLINIFKEGHWSTGRLIIHAMASNDNNPSPKRIKLETCESQSNILDISMHTQSIVDQSAVAIPELQTDATVDVLSKEDEDSTQLEADDESGKQRSGKVRLPKKKYAVVLGYCGTNYHGMQIQKGVRTIEKELFSALQKSGCITEDIANNPDKGNFQRCARTDKGVHAARQVVSLNMHVPEPGTIDVINSHLPPDIRVLWIPNVTKGFNSYTAFTARTYHYISPTYAFMPKGQPSIDYRIDDVTLSNVNSVLQKFVGTRNYHNFTSRIAYTDGAAQRYIISFECGKPFVRNGLEFVTLAVRGQSFVLNQIRKMIGLTMAIVRGYTDGETTLPRAFSKERIDVPRAPSLGLYLDAVSFDIYNKKFQQTHTPLLWDHLDEKVNQLKEEHIHRQIIETEASTKEIYDWLKCLQVHTYDGTGFQSTTDNEHEQNDEVDAK